MLFGGLQKSSLIDYPGKLSCVLFLSGCNFDCPYCHNPGLVKGRFSDHAQFEEKTVYDFLEKRRGFLDGVVVSGGEPTLQKDLVSLCEKLKEMGYPVKLDTNGSRPQVLRSLIDEGLVDYIAMDIKTDPLRYSSFIKNDFRPEHLFSSIRIIMESAPAYEFRTTCVKPIVDYRAIRNIAKMIKGAMLYVLQGFRNTNVLHPEVFRDAHASYDEHEMNFMGSIAGPWVEKCLVRC